MAYIPGLTYVAPAPSTLRGNRQKPSSLLAQDNHQNTRFIPSKDNTPQFIRQSGNTTLTTTASPTLPDRYNNGDKLLLVAVSVDSTINDMSGSGWTLEYRTSGAGFNDVTLWSRVADGTETTPVTVTTPAGTAGWAATGAYRAPNGNPIRFLNLETDTNTTPATTLSITSAGSFTPTAAEDTVLFCLYAGIGSSAPSGASIVGNGTLTAVGGGAFGLNLSTLRVTVVGAMMDQRIQAIGTGTFTMNVVSAANHSGIAIMGMLTTALPTTTTVDATATLSSTATLTASANLERLAVASLSATATLIATAVREQPATATLSSTASLTATATVVKPATATLSSTATLTATADVTKQATATLSSTATLTGLANSTVNATAALSATATLTATATPERFATVALSSTATLTATAVVSKIATAALSSTATLTTTAVVTKNATTALSSTATLTITVLRETFVTVSLSSTATLTASTSTSVNATAALTATATLTVSTITLTRFGVIALTATATLFADPDITSVNDTGFAGWASAPWGIIVFGGAYTQPGTTTRQVTVSLTSTATLTANPTIARAAVATLTSTASLTALGNIVSGAVTATLFSVATLTATFSSAIWIEFVVNNGSWSIASVSSNPYIEASVGTPLYTQNTPSGSTWVEVPVVPKVWS